MKYNLFKVKEIRDNGKERLIYYLLKDYSPTLNNYSYQSYINGDEKVVTYEGDVDFSSTKELKVYINNVLKKPLFYNGKQVNPKDFETKRGRELSSHNIDVNSERVSSYRPIFKVKDKEEEIIPKEKGKEDSNRNNLVLKNLLLSSKFKNNCFFLKRNLLRFGITSPIAVFVLTLNSFFTTTIKKSYRIKEFYTNEGIKLEEEEIKGTTLNYLKANKDSIEFNSIIDKELVEELYNYFISNLREE